jgi:hypothetical protein
VDLEDPSEPVEVGFPQGAFPFGWSVTMAALCHGMLFVGDQESGAFAVLDLANPAEPSSVAHERPVSTITCAGNVGYLASDGWLEARDYSHPEAPVALGRTSVVGPISEVAAFGRYVHVGNRSAYRILDVSDPSQPRERGSLPYSNVERIELRGSTVAITSWTRNSPMRRYLTMVDPTDPQWPRDIAAGPVVSALRDQYYLSWPYLYASDTIGLRVLDVRIPDRPEPTAGDRIINRFVEEFLVDGTRAYVKDNQRAVTILDLSNPALPTVLGRIEYDGFPGPVAAHGPLVFLGVWGGGPSAAIPDGIRIWDVSNPAASRQVSSIPIEGSLLSMVPAGPRRILARMHPADLYLIDASDPSHPRVVKLERQRWETWESECAAEESLLYCGSSGAGLVIYRLP